tara:strand:+ start:5686 stop:6171 length:486 start_codon:yes stop_codon:yes gene_type:complete
MSNNIPDKINTGLNDGGVNILEKQEAEINITSCIMTFMSYSIKSSSIYVEHSGRTIITPDDIKRAMMVEVFMYFKRSDLKVRVDEWRNILLTEIVMSEEEDEDSDSEEEEIKDKVSEEIKHKKVCSCEVCNLMNTIKDNWQYYNPEDELGKIFKKHIDGME